MYIYIHIYIYIYIYKYPSRLPNPLRLTVTGGPVRRGTQPGCVAWRTAGRTRYICIYVYILHMYI